MQVRWVRKALRNLEQAHAYSAKDNPEAAMRTVLKIQVAVDRLGQFPLMGRIGRVEGTRELVIANTSYFVIYGLKDNTVEILRVLRTSRRYPD
jgi:toxin ParE1/3/4